MQFECSQNKRTIEFTWQDNNYCKGNLSQCVDLGTFLVNCENVYHKNKKRGSTHVCIFVNISVQ